MLRKASYGREWSRRPRLIKGCRVNYADDLYAVGVSINILKETSLLDQGLNLQLLIYHKSVLTIMYDFDGVTVNIIARNVKSSCPGPDRIFSFKI